MPRFLLRALPPVTALPAVLLLTGTVAAQDLTKITGVDPVLAVQSSRSVTWVDVDGDDDLDLYVTNGGSLFENNEFYRNDGGVFAAQPGAALALDSLRADGATWGDYDGDGDEDVFVVSWYGEVNGLFRNDGAGAFSRVDAGAATSTGTYSEGCAWVDPDHDGDLDLFIANSGDGTANGRDNLFYRNDGGTLVELGGLPMTGEGSTTRHPAWGDYDNDGDLDLFLANESGENNRLFQNRFAQTGTLLFVEQSLAPLTTDGGESFTASWGDFDNDGDLDLIVGNWSGENNFLYRNQLVETGSATFVSVLDQDPALNMGWVVGTQWADWDNDADLDLMFTNGFGTPPSRTRKNFFYRNDGGTLVRTTASAAAADSGWSYAGSWGDMDGDGDLDLAIANWQGSGQANYLYRNEAQANGNHWLQVRCAGTVSNRSGIGCRIRAVATVNGQPLSQIREVTGADGYCSQNLVQHFGLADAAVVDSLVVSWPSGVVQVLTAVPADTLLRVVEPTAVDAPVPSSGLRGAARIDGVAPNPFRRETTVLFTLQGGAADAALTVVDAAGRRVRSLDGGRRPGGAHRAVWDGADASGRPVPSGVYFVRLEEGGRVADVRKLLRLR